MKHATDIELMRLKHDPHVTQLFLRADLGTVLAVRAGGGAEITDVMRDELLAKIAAHRYVELQIDLLAFEQRSGEMNRNFVRFREAAFPALGRSGRSTPFLRDHEQGDIRARGGTIVASTATAVEGEEGRYRLEQTARVTAPWAVEALLLGHIDRFSIGWTDADPPHCSACNASWLLCPHWPGDRLEEFIGDDGNRRYRRSPTGKIRVQLIYQNPVLVETSAVSVPAVPSAQIEGIRAALAAARGEADGTTVVALSHAYLGAGDEERRRTAERLINSGREPQENDSMSTLKSALAAKLNVGATASDDEFVTAVGKLQADIEAKDAKLALVEAQRERLSTEIAAFKVKEQQVAEDELVRDALNSGRIAAGEEVFLRRSFKADPEGTRADVAKLAAGSATPVGQPRASAAPAPAALATPVQISERQRRINAQLGMSDEQYIANLKKGAQLQKGGN